MIGRSVGGVARPLDSWSHLDWVKAATANHRHYMIDRKMGEHDIGPWPVQASEAMALVERALAGCQVSPLLMTLMCESMHWAWAYRIIFNRENRKDLQVARAIPDRLGRWKENCGGIDWDENRTTSVRHDRPPPLEEPQPSGIRRKSANIREVTLFCRGKDATILALVSAMTPVDDAISIFPWLRPADYPRPGNFSPQ